MSASGLQVVTEVITNLDAFPESTILPADISYATVIDSDHIVTLSTGSITPGQGVSGLIYVPTLKTGDPCIPLGANEIPGNVTRKADLPPVDGDLSIIALAPWLNSGDSRDAGCVLKYIDAAGDDKVQGVVFFTPTDRYLFPASSGYWEISKDGGGVPSDDWKNDHQFPVFVISHGNGQELMQQLAIYSGNLTDLPNADAINAGFDESDYVRLAMEVDLGLPSTLPSLWVLLLLVLGIVLGLMGITSLAMHWVQRRRRRDLRRRVASGEVDLEALGIKRLTVPQDVIDDMPLYTYGSGVAIARATNSAGKDSTTIEATKAKPAAPTWNPPPTIQRSVTPSHIPTTLLQPTCPICLEDFHSPNPSQNIKGTTVRELPCQHIFHPECVDTFLRDNSSLCPMCKKAALPAGYCPKNITNAMVRRERIVRRRGPVGLERTESSPGRRSRMVSWGAGMVHQQDRTRRSVRLDELRRASRRARSPPAVVERADPETGNAVDEPAVTPAQIAEDRAEVIEPARSDPPSNAGRREWARQRAVAMLGRREAPADPDAEEARTMPNWRKALVRIFPAAGPR